MPIDYPFVWPVPPFPAYTGASSDARHQACAIESHSGYRHAAIYTGMNLAERTLLIQLPGGHAPLALHFFQIRSVVLDVPLAPRSWPQGEADSDPAPDQLPSRGLRSRYRLWFVDGSVRRGQTVGRIENAAGLFTFHPADPGDHVRRVFYPREAYRHCQSAAESAQREGVAATR